MTDQVATMTESLQSTTLSKVPEPPGMTVSVVASEPPQERSSKRRRILAVLLLILTAAYLIPMIEVLYRVGDQGTILYGAQRVSEGAIPGRDFVEVIGPAAFYYPALFFKLLGLGWQVTRFQLLLTGLASAGVLYAIARSVCDESTAVFCWFFTLVMGMAISAVSSHHWDSNLFAILALWCYLRFEKTRGSGWIATAGSLVAVADCFIPTKGLFLLLAFLASVSFSQNRAKARSISLLLAGYAATGIAVLGAFWKAAALNDLINANIFFPLSGYGRINAVPYAQVLTSAACFPAFQAFSSRWALAGLICAGLCLIPFLLIAALPLLSVASVSLGVRKAAGRIRWTPLLSVFVAGLALWLSELHRKDIFHLIFGSPILVIALFASAPAILPRWLRKLCVVAITAGLVAFGVLNCVTHVRGNHVTETRRGTVISSAEGDALHFLSTAVNQGEFVFIYPYQPVYYYLAGVRNPTRYSILLYGYNTPAQFAEVIGDLEGKRVPWVLWDTFNYGDKLRFAFPAYRHPSADKLYLEQYLERRYELVGLKSGFRILHRRSDPLQSQIHAK